MKINIQKGVKSFLSKEEYKYLLLLEFHKKFTKEIGKIQANLISDFEILHSDNIAKRVQKKQEIEDKVETLITKLNIPFTLFSPIYNLILYGAINDTNRPLFVYGYRASKGRDIVRLPKILRLKYPTITIFKSLTKSEFNKAINDVWYQIQKAMQELDYSANIPDSIKKIGIRDIETDIQIYRYKTKDKLSHKEIQSKLSEVKINLEEETIRKRFSDMGKLLKKIGFI